MIQELQDILVRLNELVQGTEDLEVILCLADAGDKVDRAIGLLQENENNAETL